MWLERNRCLESSKRRHRQLFIKESRFYDASIVNDRDFGRVFGAHAPGGPLSDGMGGRLGITRPTALRFRRSFVTFTERGLRGCYVCLIGFFRMIDHTIAIQNIIAEGERTMGRDKNIRENADETLYPQNFHIKEKNCRRINENPPRRNTCRTTN
ncbi:hypothetical protein GWI33_007004 [Rhynchophorus ferrugineus]|uniref:Uncharacterized protein n=1 Tax=Rhynchophorus ferrugineus TaxID=354439 RepID=A0A834IKY2_RHYFE|nr:hypothetical protein GWI33_007004 [Rhynchophorus ferrugineus]